jgi:CubicO group peptidase (beta-lactamase class C family)
MLGTPWRRAVNTMLLEPLGITPVPERRDFATHYGSSVSRGHEWNTSVEQFVALSLDQQIMSDTSLGANSFCFTIKEIVSLARLGLNDGASPDGKRLLSAELAREMRSFQIDVPGHHLVDSWGLGWLHFDDHSYGFEAAGAGHQGFVQIFPEEKEILVVLGNVFPSLVIYFDVLRAFNDGPHKNSAQKSAIDEKLCIGSYSTDGNRLVVEEGKRRLEYRYFRRLSQEEWRETDYGELVPSSIGAFNPKSAKGIRRSTFTPIWSGGGSDPRFFRVGLLILRRDEEPAGDVGVGESTATA